MRRTLGVVLCMLPLAVTFVAGAPQLRSVTEGVYSAAQAERGQEVYRSQCNECHGNALQDRKSTRLNSSHSQISYAVFCLKKKRPYQRLLCSCKASPTSTLPSSLP